MDRIQALIQRIITNPSHYLDPLDTNIIGLDNIIRQIFEVIGVQSINELNVYTGTYGGLSNFLYHAIRNPTDFTPTPSQEWILASNGIRGPSIEQQPIRRRSASAYKKKYFSDEEGEVSCGICFGTYTSDNPACMVSQCGHVFHCTCIDSWTRSNNANKNKCPTCKRAIESIQTVNVEDLKLSELEMYKDTALFDFGRTKAHNEIKYLRSLNR